MSANYRPWRENQCASLMAWAVGAACLVAAGLEVIAWLPALCGAAVAFWLATVQRRQAQVREFGKRFEEHAVNNALPVLRRYGLAGKRNYMMAGGGDVDLVVERRGGSRCVTVEVKSFVYWRTYLFIFNGRREARAVKQARGQAHAMKAKAALIWLPQGRRRFWQTWSQLPSAGAGVRLVFGNAEHLAQAIKQVI